MTTTKNTEKPSNFPATMTTTTPNSTAAAAGTTRPFTPTTTTPPRPQSPFQIHHQHIYPVIRPQTQTPNPLIPPNHQGVLYPVASSGRGFIPRPVRPQQDQTPANQVAYHPRGAGVAYRPHTPTAGVGSPSSRSHPNPQQLGDLHHLHNVQQQHLMMSRQHPTHLQHHNYVGLGLGVGSVAAPIKGIPVTGQLKVAPSPVSDSNGYKNLRDRSRDDNLMVVRDRKVRISDGAPLYSLCRSWLRNGFPEESEVHYGDSVKPLPRPLLPKEESEEEVEKEKKDEEPVDHLSAAELLKRHIKHAKKVRARLREGRLKRIARYKSRLALLLPPQVEQFRNDTPAEN
ncbi:lysine-rich arabinogalactan protein 19 [Populus alba x Populus x berolinensis]|nr:lysine-rich arabinogalactan protein 19 [Populus alba x Populus x berolinensis]